MLNYIKRNLSKILIIAILLVLFLPFILTRNINGIDFTHTGEIGDTIGGISAPIIGLLTSVLLYLALIEQKDATLLQKQSIDDQKVLFTKERDYELVLTLIRNIKDDFNSVTFELEDSGSIKNYSGVKVFWIFNQILQRDEYTKVSEPELNQLILKYAAILKQFIMAANKISESTIELGDKRSFFDSLEIYKSPLGMFAQAIALKGTTHLFPNHSKKQDTILKALPAAFGLLDIEFKTKKPK